MGNGHAGRRYIVVGGTSGMGHATARLLIDEGADVAIVGRSQAKADAVAQKLAAQTGAKVVGVGSDIGDLCHAVNTAADRLGGLDGLAVTAGPVGRMAPFAELRDTDWAESFETQLMTVVRACRAGLPLLAAGGGGTIVTMAAYSIRAQKALLPHYAAMKSAVASLTKNIAKVHGAQGIRANCIAPGTIATEALDATAEEAAATYGMPRDAALNRFMTEHWGMKVALDRIGTSRDVGELIAFLLSTQATYLTGALINIDGGTDF